MAFARPAIGVVTGHHREREQRLGVHVIRIPINESLHFTPVCRLLVGFVFVDLMFRCADVKAFMLRNLVLERFRLLQRSRSIVILRPARVQSLKLAPIRHRCGGIEAGSLFERTVGFEIPKVVE